MDHAEGGAMRRYDPNEIEPRWQQRWLDEGLYELNHDGMARHGADALRLAILVTKPPADVLDVDDSQLTGCERFLHRVWRLAATDEATIDIIVNTVRTGRPIEGDRAVEAATHVLIDRVTADHERRASNAMVAAFMAFTNTLYRYLQSDEGAHGPTLAFAIDTLLLLMAPAVPHITAELWSIRHDGGHIHTEPWPSADPDRLTVASVTMIVQVNGKVGDRIEVSARIAPADAEALAIGSKRVRARLKGRQPAKIIVRAPKLVNIVV